MSPVVGRFTPSGRTTVDGLAAAIAGGIERAFDLAASLECTRGRPTREHDQQQRTFTAPDGAARRDDVALQRRGIEDQRGAAAGRRAGAWQSRRSAPAREPSPSAGSLAASRAPVARTSTTRNAACACTAGSVCEETLVSNTRTWRVAAAGLATASRRQGDETDDEVCALATISHVFS